MFIKNPLLNYFIFVILFFAFELTNNSTLEGKADMSNTNINEVATFGSGCFWCTEAVFEKLNGVESVISGYSGGTKNDPTYEEICTGETGHAEVTQISFDPTIISFTELLEVFWKTHDPTTLNRQGSDVGTQYRSAIFYHNDEQKRLSDEYKNKLTEAKVFEDKIVTEITKFEKFYSAENYHQDYYEQNKNQPYCSFVITPKVEKFKEVFKDKLK
jgi:peptide-methionine (S)-S-oxide reductase